MYFKIEDLKVQQKNTLSEVELLRKLAGKFYDERGINTNIRDLSITDLIKEVRRTILLCQDLEEK